MEEEEELFEDAKDDIILSQEEIVQKQNYFIVDVHEERETLPHLRSPGLKVSFWQILKDLIGKDLTKISLPVYFNEPLSLTQKVAECLDYTDLLERAALEPNCLLRLALVSAWTMARFDSTVRRMQKPFNSLLGETYELVTTKWRMVAEQVKHHPPVTAVVQEGKHFEVFMQQETSARFNGRYVNS